MRQNQSRVDSKRAEHLFCLDVVEVIETTLERLTIERHNMHAETGPGMVQVGRMLTKDIFNIRRAQPLQNIPDGGMSGWPFPSDLKGSHNRENGKQQDMRQLVKFAFGAPRIGDC